MRNADVTGDVTVDVIVDVTGLSLLPKRVALAPSARPRDALVAPLFLKVEDKAPTDDRTPRDSFLSAVDEDNADDADADAEGEEDDVEEKYAEEEEKEED